MRTLIPPIGRVGTGLLSEVLQAEFELTDGASTGAVETAAAEDPGNDAVSLTASLNKWTLALLVPLYFASMFLATFFNVAF